MGNEVLVTGAAGFIGRPVANACVAAGWRVTTLDNRLPAADVLDRTEFLLADLSDPDISNPFGTVGSLASCTKRESEHDRGRLVAAGAQQRDWTYGDRLGLRAVRRPVHLCLVTQRLRPRRARRGHSRGRGARSLLRTAQSVCEVQAPVGYEHGREVLVRAIGRPGVDRPPLYEHVRHGRAPQRAHGVNHLAVAAPGGLWREAAAVRKYARGVQGLYSRLDRRQLLRSIDRRAVTSGQVRRPPKGLRGLPPQRLHRYQSGALDHKAKADWERSGLTVRSDDGQDVCLERLGAPGDL